MTIKISKITLQEIPDQPKQIVKLPTDAVVTGAVLRIVHDLDERSRPVERYEVDLYYAAFVPGTVDDPAVKEEPRTLYITGTDVEMQHDSDIPLIPLVPYATLTTPHGRVIHVGEEFAHSVSIPNDVI